MVCTLDKLPVRHRKMRVGQTTSMFTSTAASYSNVNVIGLREEPTQTEREIHTEIDP